MNWILLDRLQLIEDTLQCWGQIAETDDFAVNWKEQIDATQEYADTAAVEAKGLLDEIARREVRKALVVVGKCLERARAIYPMRQLAKTARQIHDLNVGKHLLYIIPECQRRLSDARAAVESMETQRSNGPVPGRDDEFFWNGQALKLQPKDARLLCYLWRHNYKSSFEDIIRDVWDGKVLETAVKSAKNRIAKALINTPMSIRQNHGHLELDVPSGTEKVLI